jgi:hypothetical protein
MIYRMAPAALAVVCTVAVLIAVYREVAVGEAQQQPTSHLKSNRIVNNP